MCINECNVEEFTSYACVESTISRQMVENLTPLFLPFQVQQNLSQTLLGRLSFRCSSVGRCRFSCPIRGCVFGFVTKVFLTVLVVNHTSNLLLFTDGS